MTQESKNKLKKSIFRDEFGNIYFIKRIIVFVLGFYSYLRYNRFKKLIVSGTENLSGLPRKNVMIISNHQTYYAEVIVMYHVFSSLKNGFINSLKNPVYLLNPIMDFYYVAAIETMKNQIILNLVSYFGAIKINRIWRSAGLEISRELDKNAVNMIQRALDSGWLINFPQGTTKPFAPCRKGVAHTIKEFKPIVIPVVLDGFKKTFGQNGLFVNKKGINYTMTIKSPLQIDYENESIDDILEKVMDSIEQSDQFY